MSSSTPTPKRETFLAHTITRDRLPVAPLEPGPERSGLRRWAWGSIAVLFVVGWGRGTILAVQIAVTDAFPPQTIPWTAYGVAVSILVAVLGGVLAFRVFAKGRPALARERSWPMLIPVTMAITLAGFALAAGVTAVFGFQERAYPFDANAEPLFKVLQTISAALAGPAEELALLALVVLALRRCGYSWWTVGLVAVLVRVPFHLYYGWGAIGLALWAVLAVALYRWCGTILPFIIGHALGNVLTALAMYVPGLEWLTSVKGAVTLLGVVIPLVYVCRGEQRWNRAAVTTA